MVILLFILGAGDPQERDPEVPDISKRINEFTFDLLKHQAALEDCPANAVLSPQSLFHGLAMSYIASDGETRKELGKVFHFPEKSEQLVEDLARIRQQLHNANKHKGISVTMANSVWLDETFADFRKNYVNQVQDAFEAPLHRLKFEQKQRASDVINKWVSEKTHGKIQKSVDPSDFNSRSQLGIIDEPSLITVNAVYFKADWASQFDKATTRKRNFHTDKTSTVETPMMHQLSSLPYIDNDFSMYVVLPKNIICIRELMQIMTIDQIFELRRRTFRHEVDVFFPKFKIKTHIVAREALSAMGVKSAFSNQKADFDKMIIKKLEAFRVYINEVYHDAWIDVHEEGTEAAAATSTMHFSIGCSAPYLPMPAEFHADHPFLFMIVHNESRSILFAGWISNPESIAKQMRPADR